MARPTDLPGSGWATNGGRTAIDTAKWAVGWVPGEPVPALKINDLIGRITDWVEYLQVTSPTEGVWTVINSGTTYGTLGYSTTSGSWLTLVSANGRSGLQIEAGSATTTHVVRQTMTPGASPTWTLAYDPAGADVIMLKVGALGMIGPTAVGSASTGIRYGYPGSSKQVVRHALGPELGGYTPIRETGISGVGPVMEFSTAPRVCRLANAASSGTHVVVFRRPLLVGNPTGQLSGYPVCTSFGATFSGSADDLYLRIWGVNRSTGNETALTAIISATTPTASGTYTMDPTTYDYFVEIYTPTAITHSSVTSDSVRAVYAVVEWQALVPVM